jgi:hypothetical protein
MRSDMKRKLIESPRWGSWMPNHSVLRDRALLRHARADDSFDRFARRGAMRPHHGDRKDLTDKLNPLIRFVRKSRGRLWDEVYSELRALLSPRSVIDMHILQHLDQFVLLHVRVDAEGRVFNHPPRFRWGAELFANERQWFVHPETGRLCEPTHRRPKRRRDAP